MARGLKPKVNQNPITGAIFLPIALAQIMLSAGEGWKTSTYIYTASETVN